MAASYLIGQLTAGQDVKIIKDLGLSATSLFGLFIAVFIGIGLVSKEVERRSVYSLLAKPIHRYQMVVGKYAGLVLTLIVNVAIMAAAQYVVLAYMGWGVLSGCPAVVGCAGSRSGDLEGDRIDSRRADGDHGNRALLLDVFNPDSFRGFHVRILRRRTLQHRSSKFRTGRRLAGGRQARTRAVLDPAEPRAIRRQDAGRSRPARPAWLHAVTSAYAALLHRRPAGGSGGHLFAP